MRLACLRRPPRARRGCRGERLAARHLRRSGYRILARNLRVDGIEVDLLARESRWLVLVEVKTVGGPPPREGMRLVRRQQIRRLCRAGRTLARRAGLRTAAGAPAPLRFDLAVVSLDGGRPVVTIRRDAWRDRSRP